MRRDTYREPVPEPKADRRQYGDPDGDDLWSAATDPLESFLLDITNPERNMQRGCHGFDVDAAKAVAAKLRRGFADGVISVADLAVPAAAVIGEAEYTG